MTLIVGEIVVLLIIDVDFVKLANSAVLLASVFSLPAWGLGVGRGFVCEMGVKLDWILKIARKVGLGEIGGRGYSGELKARTVQRLIASKVIMLFI